jgi:hypothetical protein
MVSEVTRPGSYRLTQMNGTKVGEFMEYRASQEVLSLSNTSNAIGAMLYSVIGKYVINKRSHSLRHSSYWLSIDFDLIKT